ncbi:MAG: hypothetical protein V4666_08305 [Bacteroidota bacterium]
MENSKPVIGSDFNSDGITCIVVGQVVDGVFTILESKEMNCKRGDDTNKDSEFRRFVSELAKKWNAEILGTNKSFRKLEDRLTNNKNKKWKKY